MSSGRFAAIHARTSSRKAASSGESRSCIGASLTLAQRHARAGRVRDPADPARRPRRSRSGRPSARRGSTRPVAVSVPSVTGAQVVRLQLERRERSRPPRAASRTRCPSPRRRARRSPRPGACPSGSRAPAAPPSRRRPRRRRTRPARMPSRVATGGGGTSPRSIASRWSRQAHPSSPAGTLAGPRRPTSPRSRLWIECEAPGTITSFPCGASRGLLPRPLERRREVAVAVEEEHGHGREPGRGGGGAGGLGPGQAGRDDPVARRGRAA